MGLIKKKRKKKKSIRPNTFHIMTSYVEKFATVSKQTNYFCFLLLCYLESQSSLSVLTASVPGELLFSFIFLFMASYSVCLSVALMERW